MALKCQAAVCCAVVYSVFLLLFVVSTGSKDYQLVTWSRDQTLRIWRVDPQLQKVSVQPQRAQTDMFSDVS